MSRSAVGLVFIFCAVAVGPLYAQSPLETALAATVTIEVVRTEGASSGSGFIASSDGVIVTAAHVIENALSVLVRLQSGEEFAVEGVIEVDRDRDYAFIRIAGFDLPTVPLGNSNEVAVGQKVLAIGAPLGLDATVSDGLVGAFRVRDGVRRIQITIPVSPGSSGGPVVTEAGEVVGLVVTGIRGSGAENLNFALPINYVRGRLALASAIVPQPLSPFSPAPISNAGTRPVNDSLRLSANLLHGATFYQEDEENSYETKATTSYVVAGTVSGASRITRTYSGTTFFDGNPVSRTRIVSFWETDASSSGESQTVTVLDSRFLHWATSMEWQITGTTVTVDSAGVWTRGFAGSLGVIPVSMVAGVVAVLDSIPVPSQLSLRQGEYDSSRRRFVESDVLIDFVMSTGSTSLSGIGIARVRVPRRRGQPCNENTRTEGVTIQVIEGRIEAELVHWSYQRPHLTLSGDMECVSFPLSR